MGPLISQYLDHIRDGSRLSISEEKEVISELETHIEDKLLELKESGLSDDEAVNVCLEQIGPAKSVSRQIYEAYSQGNWQQVLLASMPHLLFGLLFALNWWHYIGWLVVVLGLVLGAAIYGWWHGKPAWVFSWLGYVLVPVIAAGLLLLYLPQGWSLLAIPIYIPLALWWLFHIIIQSARRDWLLATLMLLPLPIILGWFMAVSPGLRFSEASLVRLYNFAPWISVSFLSMALTIAAFIRLRKRWLRISLLVISGLLMLTLVVYYTMGRLNALTLAGLMLVMWGVFLIPALLDHWLRSGRHIFRKQETAANN